jgi:DNA-binding MarR family transcriptional regulator
MSTASERPAAARKKTRAAAGAGASVGAEGPARFDFQSDSLGYALRRAQMRAYDLFFAMLGSLELSPARVTALSIIAMEPSINQSSLAKRLDIAGPSALKLVDALEAAGFISRRGVEGDRRRYSLMLTAAGRAQLESVRAQLAAYEARLAAQLSGAERAQLMSLLERVAL